MDWVAAGERSASQTRGKTRHHVASLTVGMRAASYRRTHFHDAGTRIAGFLDGLTAAGERGQKDLDRLTLAREVLGVQLKGRRSTSRLPALVDPLLSKPLVSATATARRCELAQAGGHRNGMRGWPDLRDKIMSRTF